MKHKQSISWVIIWVATALVGIDGCTDNRNTTSRSEFARSIKEKKLLTDLVERYLSKLQAKVKADFDSSSQIVDIGLDSTARIEAFKPFWQSQISNQKTSDSLDFIFYDSLFKGELSEHLVHKRFPDSIRYFKSQIRILESKLDSARHGLFGNPVLEQFARLRDEKGNAYFLVTQVTSKNVEELKLYFGIEELEQDTVVSWTTGKSLANYMWQAVYRRNPSFWTKKFVQPKDTTRNNSIRKV